MRSSSAAFAAGFTDPGFTWRGYLRAQFEKWMGGAHLSTLLPSARKRIGDIGRTAHQIPEPPRSTILHGDFCFRNILCHPRTGEPLAVIDFENALIGDPAYDLAKLPWVDLTLRAKRGRDALVAGWTEVTGLSVDRDLLDFYERIQALAAIAWVDKRTTDRAQHLAFRRRAIARLLAAGRD